MDPVANMTRQLELAREIIDTDAPDEATANLGAELAELVVAQYEWAQQGGFPPPASEMAQAMRQRAEAEAEERGVGIEQIMIAATPDGQHVHAFVLEDG